MDSGSQPNNYRAPGEVLKLAAPYDRTAGQMAKVGALIGVALIDVLETVEGPFSVQGVYDDLAKLTTDEWTVGARLYWDDTNKRLDMSSAAGQLAAIALETTANPSTAGGKCVLVGPSPELLEGAQAAVVVLTDSTGASGSHDDTLADGLTATSPSAITNYTAVVNMTDPVAKAEGEAVSAALATLQDEVTLLRATVDACVTDLGVQNQNDSDLAQKIIEIRAALVTAGLITA